MISKSLSRRLKRLQEEISPGEPKTIVIHVTGVTADGQRVSGPEFKVEIPRGVTKPRPR